MINTLVPKTDNIQLIALDMDGTLLMSDKSVHPDTLRAIKDAVNSGIYVAYCTGRAVAELSSYTDILSPMRYGVCLCGAQIYDFKERRSIHKRPINTNFVKKIVSVSEEYGAMVQLLTEDRSLVRHDQIDHMENYGLQVEIALFKKIATCVDSMDEAMKDYGTILKSNVHFPSPAARDEAYERLKAFPLSAVYSETSTLELMAEGVSKASGLTMLARCLNIPMSKVMGIGDGNNDRQMLLSSGFSVAMGNSGNELKDIADLVTEDNDHNGAGIAIRHCLTTDPV